VISKHVPDRDRDEPPASYSGTASVLIARPAAEIMPWLVTPSLMSTWIIGTDTIEPRDDARPAVGSWVRVVLSGAQYSFAMTGEIVELTDDRLVREYRLDQLGGRAVQLKADPGEYLRTVSYRLSPAPGGTNVTCAAVTTTPGLSQKLLPRSARADTRSLVRSLARLRTRIDGGRVGLWQRFADSGKAPEPL
jgi:uncharacterized protein YndB with AHSA1/START domain